MRYLDKPLKQFASEKFVLVSGPRQVGKTTLAKTWLGTAGPYLNWDIPEDRSRILSPAFMGDLKEPKLVLDEIHKYARWKSWLKGLYDKTTPRLEAVVTGSARLDVYQKSGDSLLGRYELLRLHPFSAGELNHGGIPAPPEDWLQLPAVHEKTTHATWKQLESRSGFPEPFKKDDSLQHRRWSARRRELLVREDMRELTQIKTLSLVEHLAILLPSRVGSPLSLNSLREELQVAHDTVSSWVEALERLYFCFRLSPYSKKISRSLRKEQKLYLWDWSQVEAEGPRLENMVASHLLKSVHAWNDLGYGPFDLHYWRDLEKREVDFVLTENRKPIVLFECKRSDPSPAEPLLRLGKLLGNIPRIQLIDVPNYDRVTGGVRVVDAGAYLSSLV